MPSYYNETVVTQVTRLVKLSYLQTVAVTSNNAALSSLAGESKPSNTSYSASDPGDPGFLGIGSDPASSVSSSFQDSGWSISRTWLETYFDKIRWAIGIRELGIYSYKYAASGEFISVPFVSPLPIDRVALLVDEVIPASYPTSQKWIHYFISADNGSTWVRISPYNHASIFSDATGSSIPKTVVFNPDFEVQSDDLNKYIKTQFPVNTIRFRAVLLRPQGGDFENSSPVLKSYRLKLYPKK